MGDIAILRVVMEYVFFGEILEIPEGAKYLSVSIDGEITAHSEMPWYEPGFWEGHEIGGIDGDGSMGRLEFGDVVCKSLFNRGPFKISG